MRTHGLRRILPGIVVLLALLPFTWLAATNWDLPQLGKYQDDGLFLIAGKSLHDSEGYRISSLPGKPFQTKYQPLYPLMLAGVWSLDGEFPHNLKLVSALQWGVLVSFFLLSFALMRSLGFEPWKCAAMVAFLAINPWLLYWGLLPISDFLFAALAIATFWALRQSNGRLAWWWAVGLLAAAAYLTKVAGILIVPAIWLGCLRGREWKRAILMTVPTLVAFAAWTLWVQVHRTNFDHSVMWYYTDYLAYFVKNGGLSALPEIVQSNLLSFMLVAGDSVLYNLGDSMLGRFLAVVILAGGISGTRRLIRRTGSVEYPAFCALLVILLLVWNFSPNVRLAAPVMPLLAMGLWEEAVHLAGLIQRAGGSKKVSDRVAAHLIRAGVLVGIVCAVFLNVQFIFRGVPGLIQNDRFALVRELGVFEWCKRSLPASSVLMANNDTLLYLSTGLSAVRAVPNSVAFYENNEAGEFETFTHIDDFERKFGLTHIVITPDDFGDFEPAQRKAILKTLLNDPRHKKIYSSGDTMVLEIQRQQALSAQ